MSVKKLLGGGGGGKKAAKAQAAALTQQTALLKQQTATMADLAAIGREQFDYYKKNYRPVEEQALKTAADGVKPDYEGITNLGGAAAQEVGRQHGIAREAYVRGLTRRGVNVDSGENRNLMLSSRLAEAADTAGAFTRANIEEADARRDERKYAEETTYNRRAGAALTGRAGMAGGTDIVSGAAAGLGNVINGYGSVAGAYGDLSAQQAKAKGGLLKSLTSLGTKIFMASKGVPA